MGRAALLVSAILSYFDAHLRHLSKLDWVEQPAEVRLSHSYLRCSQAFGPRGSPSSKILAGRLTPREFITNAIQRQRWREEVRELRFERMVIEMGGSGE